MTDHRKEINPRVPDHVIKSDGDHLTAADLMKINQVPDGMMTYPRQNGKATVIYVQQPVQDHGYRGDDLLRRFLPYFVISVMGLILLGGVAAILGMVIPMIMAAILSIVASFVSIILSLVATIIAGAVIAVAITWCQTRSEINKE